MRNKFTTLISTAVPLPIENIDTDQIIPARFLKATTREGFGENLFRDWRYEKDGTPKQDFVMNSPIYSGEILIAGKNFGCGSSREHAAWAIDGAGFRAVVSSFFAVKTSTRRLQRTSVNVSKKEKIYPRDITDSLSAASPMQSSFFSPTK